jgi:hypothetical protein
MERALPRRPAPQRPLTAQRSPAAGEGGGDDALATRLNERPAVRGQRALQEAAARGPRGAVVQRTISWDHRLDPHVFGGVERAPLYRRLQQDPSRIFITTSAGETAVTVVKTHNAREVDPLLAGSGLKASKVDYIVNISTSELAGGAKIDKFRSYTPQNPLELIPPLLDKDTLGRSLQESYAKLFRLEGQELYREQPRRGILVDTGLPIGGGLPAAPYLPSPRAPYPLAAPGERPLRPSALPGLLPSRDEGRLSLYTVLLHELGHVVQNLATPRAFKGPPKDDEGQYVPPLPPDLVDRIAYAWAAGELSNPVWSELLDFKNTADRWLTLAQDRFEGSKSTAALGLLARKTIALGDDLIPYAQVWIEYDVVSNVEHPIALARGEPIRHAHGVEQTIGLAEARRRFEANRRGPTPEDPVEPAPGPALFAELTLGNELAAPDDLPGLQSLMIANARRLTAPLVDLVKTYVQDYQQLVQGL